MQTEEKRFQEATANGNSVDDRAFCMLFKELKKISKNGHCFSSPRTLKDLTSIKFYECTPKGKIPALVQKLKISKELKIYLCLNVEPLL